MSSSSRRRLDVSVAETESGEGVMGGRRTGLALLEEL